MHRKKRTELLDEYRAAVDTLSERVKALQGLCGDAFDEAYENLTKAQKACDDARAELLGGSGESEP